MRALPEIQNDFTSAILADMPQPLIEAIRRSPIAPDRRIAIYRNHFLITVVECLGITFPVLKALVGEAFFAKSARRYARLHPPASPVLFEYGRNFPEFLADETGSASFGYLADVGAFEWAVNHAYHADDAQPIDTSALKGVPTGRSGDIVLALHPSARLFRSAYPVLDIWRANQPGSDAADVDLSSGEVRAFVWRHGIDVVWQLLDDGQYAFVRAVMTGATLGEACATALAVDPSYDAPTGFTDLFAGAIVVGVSLTEP